MNAKTFMSTDWVEVHGNGFSYMAKVFLTDNNKSYMMTNQNGQSGFFEVDAYLLKLGELGFFEKVMQNAKELSIKEAYKIGLINTI